MEIGASSHNRTGSAFEVNCKNGTAGLLLRENPKKIMVRKI